MIPSYPDEDKSNKFLLEQEADCDRSLYSLYRTQPARPEVVRLRTTLTALTVLDQQLSAVWRTAKITELGEMFLVPMCCVADIVIRLQLYWGIPGSGSALIGSALT